MIKIVNSGVTSTKDVKPIKVEDDGRQIITINDGDHTANITDASALQVHVSQLYADGTNRFPAMDTVGRAGHQKITDGTYTAPFEVDDDAIAAQQDTLMVICLNYVYDGAKWVRMTQP